MDAIAKAELTKIDDKARRETVRCESEYFKSHKDHTRTETTPQSQLGIYLANVLILRVFLRKENSAVGDVGQNPDQPREAADFPGGGRLFEI